MPGVSPLNPLWQAQAQVLQSKADLLAGIQGVLKERDAAYVRLLQRQGEETDALVALMAQVSGPGL